MITKLLEIRDRATMFAVVAVDMNVGGEAVGDQVEARRALLRHHGFACDGVPCILITHADGGRKAHVDPYDWGDRTYKAAHDFIVKSWNELKDGDVIDVEFILGEKPTKKLAARLERVG